MSHTPRTILIYNDIESKTCSAELSRVLKKSFGHLPVAIVTTDRHNLANNIHELRPDVFILPEIKGEESFYSRHINHDMRDLIKSHIARGNLLLTICASTYWMCEKTTFFASDDTIKTKKGKDNFNAVALNSFGPMPGYGRKSNGQEDLGGCIKVPVKVKTVNGWKQQMVWYGNGPGLFGVKEVLPDGLDVIARYKNIENQPIAACVAPFGQGNILMLGVLPHYHHGGITHSNPLWSVVTHRMHQQMFANPTRDMVLIPA